MQLRGRPILGVILLGVALALLRGEARAQPSKRTWGAPQGKVCVMCHQGLNVALVQEWRLGAHGQEGVNCYDCHRAERGDSDTMDHMGQTIATLVSPKDCARCHRKQFDEMRGSHHAKAGQILASLDNFLGEVVGGPPAVATGCLQCHGSVIKVLPGGKLDPATWPNTGIGRINPDGSRGSCSACHTRHRFSRAQAREPQTCGKCHLGPDHPQIEIYEESKHGILYKANKDRLNLDRDTWVVGVDYAAAPTCATCHMSATPKQGVTHDVGERNSWTLRPAISFKVNMVIFKDGHKEDWPEGAQPLPKAGEEMKARDGNRRQVAGTLTWKQRRDKMRDVCRQCHIDSFVTGFYFQFDNLVNLYNEKFAKPAVAIMEALRKDKVLTPAPFDEQLEWIFWELWHHEGRRARHGASMSGPDYAWWNGIYDVAKTFYLQFIPEVKKVAGQELANRLLEAHVFSKPGHKWLKEGMSKEALRKIRKFYEKRYGQ